MGAAIAQTIGGAAGGKFDQRENAGLRQLVGFLKETEFHAQFGVAVTIMGMVAGGGVVGERSDEVQLNVRHDAVIQLHMRGGAGPVAGGFGVDGSDVKFPMLVIHRLGVIGQKGRTAIGFEGEQGGGQQKAGAEREKSVRVHGDGRRV